MVLKAKDWLLIIALVLLDQITKWIARVTQPNNSIFEFITNTGAGFGILQGNNTVFIFISIGVLALLWNPLSNTKGRERLAYTALVAGIVGNLIDRLIHKAVIDFISISNFPVFNVADALITVSILYLLATAVRESFSSWNFRRQGKSQRK